MVFSHPEFLIGFAVLPLVWLLGWRSSRLRSQQRDILGQHANSGPNSTIQDIKYIGFQSCAFGLILIGMSGPKWGRGGETGVVIGRDLIIVLDFSRSMLAADIDDPVHRERWQSAQLSVRKLLERIREQRGARVGLVVFAAKPMLVCPLTSDLEHVLARLEEFNPRVPPPEIRPVADEAISSGTAIGAGIALGLHSLDSTFVGYQDLLLLSDGDGPGVETEIEPALRLASEQAIPVHVVGLGDPKHFTDLSFGPAQDEFVGTRLREELLQEIARRTQGEYIAARRELPNLSDWFETSIQTKQRRLLQEDLLPQPKDRTPWFAGLGLACLIFGWRKPR